MTALLCSNILDDFFFHLYFKDCQCIYHNLWKKLTAYFCSNQNDAGESKITANVGERKGNAGGMTLNRKDRKLYSTQADELIL